MRIIEWNCQGAFRKKNSKVLSLRPDLLIISECESEEKLRFDHLTPKPTDFFWHGDSESKGIGVFSYSEYKIERLSSYNPRYRYIIPLKVTGENESFLLFAIWAMGNKENPKEGYVGQIWLAINYYSNLLSLPCIFTGDFNSNKIWDYNERVGNHSDMVEFLKGKDIFSLYHLQESVSHGEEIHPTYHMYRKLDKPYHIDYCFASNSIIKKGFSISIDKAGSWVDLSDHVPLIIELKARPKLEGLNELFSDFLVDKLGELSADTHNRFSDLISDLIQKAIKLDTLNYSSENMSERKQLIQSYEKLLEIDILVRSLKE